MRKWRHPTWRRALAPWAIVRRRRPLHTAPSIVAARSTPPPSIPSPSGFFGILWLRKGFLMGSTLYRDVDLFFGGQPRAVRVGAILGGTKERAERI